MSTNPLEPLIERLEEARHAAGSAQYRLRQPRQTLVSVRKILAFAQAEQLTAGCIGEIDERVRVRQQQFDDLNREVNRLEEAVTAAEAALKAALPEDEFAWPDEARRAIEAEWRDDDCYFR